MYVQTAVRVKVSDLTFLLEGPFLREREGEKIAYDKYTANTCNLIFLNLFYFIGLEMCL